MELTKVSIYVKSDGKEYMEYDTDGIVFDCKGSVSEVKSRIYDQIDDDSKDFITIKDKDDDFSLIRKSEIFLIDINQIEDEDY